MTKRRFLLSALAVFLIALAIGWLAVPSRVAYFTLDKRLRIEVNGVPVEGELLGNRFSAIVTIRDAGKKHSYQLFYAGDVDMTGDMGFVVDCRQWVAPHFSLLLQTRNYPPCNRLPGDEYRSLMRRAHSMQFITNDRSTISVVSFDSQ
jgi:hypothetical protein